MQIEDQELLDDAPSSAVSNAVATPATGTPDDDDDPAEENAGENEIPVREKDEITEAPEEFEEDDEDDDNEVDDDLDDEDDDDDFEDEDEDEDQPE